MRQSIKAAGLASLLLLNLTDLSAEPLVKGFFVEKLPANSLSQAIAPGKGLVLAHVLNQSQEAITTGNYQVGVQIEDKGSVKTYSLSPKDSITPGALKTFRMAVPIDGIDKNTGNFRVFSRVNGITTWSEKYSFLQGIQSSKNKNGVTTLYTEAPVANEDRIVPKEVPFETDSSSVQKSETALNTDKKNVKVDSSKVEMAAAKVNNSVKKAETKVKAESEKAQKAVETKKETVVASAKNVETSSKTTKTAAQALKELEEKKEANAAKAAEKAKEKTAVAAAEAKTSVNRKINPSEFKKLRTMDEELIIYVVKNGDTLKSISENYYGTASKERVIADLNFIEKSSAVRVGEEIIVEVRPLSKSKS
ncbi:MAG: LysM peptidoglycan-binding domain-containing protein [Candidatus Riflebacteria bacterium]|nr:LysM peptidoglycan-binding domain-containing protein [Candidatus Riflebacteria bacterium]